MYPELFDAIVRREFPDFTRHPDPGSFTGYIRKYMWICASDSRCRTWATCSIFFCCRWLCMLSMLVRLWGFDGRAPDDKLFWSNSNKHSYPELMPELIKEHPGILCDVRS